MPPTTFDETYEPRAWTCGECRRILGVVMRDTSRVRRLWVFSFDRFGDDLPATSMLRNPPRGLFRVHGDYACDGVECSRCGAINEWAGNKESFDKLMERYPIKEKG